MPTYQDLKERVVLTRSSEAFRIRIARAVGAKRHGQPRGESFARGWQFGKELFALASGEDLGDLSLELGDVFVVGGDEWVAAGPGDSRVNLPFRDV